MTYINKVCFKTTKVTIILLDVILMLKTISKSSDQQSF